jgi:hypothetical protein
MFKVPKQVPANNIVTNDERNFVNKAQLDNINTIPSITTDLSQISKSVSTLLADSVLEINLVNETIIIINGKITLSKTPISNNLINNMYMIVERIGSDLIVHQEVVDDFAIIDNTIDLGTGFFNGLEARLSYIIEGSL